MKITLCADKLDNADACKKALLHELNHASQICLGPTVAPPSGIAYVSSDCARFICNELQASYYGQCAGITSQFARDCCARQGALNSARSVATNHPTGNPCKKEREASSAVYNAQLFKKCTKEPPKGYDIPETNR